MKMLRFQVQYFRFLENIFDFRETCFEVKLLKAFKISRDWHIKYANSLNGGLVQKSLLKVFRELIFFMLALK